MTTNHHTAIATGAAANASTFNTPLSTLDSAITTNATAIAANALLAAATTAEVVAARGSSPDLDARLDALVLAGGNVATKANGVSAAGQKVLTVDSTDGFIVGAYVTYLLNGATLEGNTIASIQAGVSLTLGTNIGTGGVLDDSYISMISTSEYLAAQAIPHAGTLMLPDTMEYANGGVFNVRAYGAFPAATGAVNTAAVQAAIAAVGTVGGTVRFAPGIYDWDTIVPQLQHSVAGTLVISGYGATIKLSAGAPRFLDFGRTDDHQTFSNIIIEGFQIDANNIGGVNHTIIGTVNAGGGTYGDHSNFENIIVRDCRVFNAPFGDADVRSGIYLATYHDTDSEATQNYIKNVLVDNVRVEGGSRGVVIIGTNTDVTPSPGVNILIDNIAIRNCYHDTGSVPTKFSASNNFYIGGNAMVGTVTIDNCQGYNSGDCGLEINNATRALVSNCVISDSWITNYYLVNYDYCAEGSANISAQKIILRDCQARRTALPITIGTGTNTTPTGYGYKIASVLPMGEVVLEGCSWYKDIAGIVSNVSDAFLLEASTPLDKLTISNFSYLSTGWTFSAASATVFGMLLSAMPTTLTMRGLKMVCDGTRSGAGMLGWRGISVNGAGAFMIEDVALAVDIASITAYSLFGLFVGGATSTLRGTVRNVRILSMEDEISPRAIYVGSTGTLTITDQIRIEDCDFSGMDAGQEVLVDASNAAKVAFVGNKWMTFPATCPAITPSGSPYTYQNLHGYNERVIVQGGTVSKIEINNTTGFADTGVIAGVFILSNAESLKVTYSSAPTMSSLPVP